ncbi:MAG: hypothetical protein L0Y56_14840, partial [Nitrospira sp.]|nr:hypothetical protein [Nitrospira sp.]
EEEYNWKGLTNLKVRGSSFLNEKGGKLDWSESHVLTSEFNPIGRWKHWTEKEKKIFHSVAGDGLRRWGYL